MRNSNGSARRNFFRSTSRRLRVGPPPAAQPPAAGTGGGGEASQAVGPSQQSLMAAQATGGAAAAMARKSKAAKQQLSPLDGQSAEHMLAADGSESPSDFGLGPANGTGTSTPGGSDGEFTYFSGECMILEIGQWRLDLLLHQIWCCAG